MSLFFLFSKKNIHELRAIQATLHSGCNKKNKSIPRRMLIKGNSLLLSVTKRQRHGVGSEAYPT